MSKLKFLLTVLAFISFLLIVSLNQTFSQEEKVYEKTESENSENSESSEKKEDIKEQINAILKIEGKDYLDQIDDYRKLMEKYIENKKRSCSGKFATVTLNDKGLPSAKGRKKLSRQERNLCFRELKNMQILFIKNTFAARKKYLNYLHQIRIEELTKSEIKIIKGLQTGLKKRGRRRRRKN